MTVLYNFVVQTDNPTANIMKKSIELSADFWNYIKNNSSKDCKYLLLRDSDKNLRFPLDFAVTQIESRQKAGRKLSVFTSIDNFIFPTVLAAEQATHQCVAAYHAQLVGHNLDVLDMTAGLGIDAMTMASLGNKVTAIELDDWRLDVFKHNISVSNLTNINPVSGDSVEWLSSGDGKNRHFDWIFVDPARRDHDNNRKYFLKDCLPDIVSAWPEISKHAYRIMVKASPIVDLNMALREIPGISEMHIVCVRGECKETLLLIDHLETEPTIKVIDLNENASGNAEPISIFSLPYSALNNDSPIATEADIRSGNYLYDPNAGLHKIACAKELCRQFKGLSRVSYNTDLYVSDELYIDFPGRIFMIQDLISGKKQKSLKGERIEIAVRNYPLTAEQLRKKLKTAPGINDRFVFGMRVGQKQNPTLVDCLRIRIPEK